MSFDLINAMDKEYVKEMLTRLCEADGVSGAEENAAAVCCELLREYGSCVYSKASGSLIFEPRKQDSAKPTVLLDAHIDEIGMIVTDITEDGFLRFDSCGGLDVRALPAAQVTVLAKEKLCGVITSVPPHLQASREKAAAISDLYIDIGMSGKRAKELVSRGDRVLIENRLISLRGDIVTSKALDNRAGVAAVILALQELCEKNLGCNVKAIFTSREETSGAGAKTAAYAANADMAIAVDVSFAQNCGESAEECGRLGGGPMIGISPVLSRKMSSELMGLAAQKDIPFQTEVMAARTGTDADHISISGKGVPTVTVSVPQRNMHTPVETVDLNDIINTARLIAAYLENIK